jgi:hypothetical protein
MRGGEVGGEWERRKGSSGVHRFYRLGRAVKLRHDEREKG